MGFVIGFIVIACVLVFAIITMERMLDGDESFRDIWWPKR